VNRIAPRPRGVAPLRALFLVLLGCAPAFAQKAPEDRPSVPAASEVPAAAQAPLGERLEERIRARFDRGDLASLQVAVRRGSELLWTGALGYADLEHRVPADAETIYRIASVTKQFTAARLLQQVAAGEIGLEDDVRTVLKDLPTGGHAVTVRQLLDHTSGIPSYTDLGPAWVAEMGKPLRYEGLLELLADEEHGFAPGTDWAYNNSAYFAAGELIAELGRGGYRRQIEKELLEPLGLVHTSLEDHAALVPHRARGYTHIDFSDTFRNALYMHPSQPGGAGALLSTAEDLVAWEVMLMGGEVLAPELLEQMTTSSVLADGREPGYGFGLALGELRGVERWVHSGGIFGCSSMLSGYPEAELAIALITNVGDKGLGPLELELAELVLADLGLAAPLPTPGAALERDAAEPYLGHFEFNGLSGQFEWHSERGLVAKFQGERRLDLRPIGEHTLRVVGNPAGPDDVPAAFTDEQAADLDVTLRFGQVEDGRAQRCTLIQRGGRQVGVRVDRSEHAPRVRADLTALSNAIDNFAIENAGRWPASLDELIEPPGGGPAFLKGNRIPTDPWGAEYLYEAPEGDRGYRITTLGADGKVGGTGDDADRSNLDES
jgi:CubicO group peptidase (beta-lactamase class C family)